MLKTLLYINEDLASSIALRYTDYLHRFIPLSLFVTHVEEPDEKEQVGTGLVRRAWTDGVESTGKRLIDRMLRTENIDCPLAGRPKVFVGDREKEIIYELRSGLYDLYVEGYLDTGDPERFYELISSPLYTQVSCPVLVVKNLSISKRCALFCSDSVEPGAMLDKILPILGKSKFSLDIFYFRFKENDAPEEISPDEAGANLRATRDLLAKAGIEAGEIKVICGTPEKVGDMLKDYALVATALPRRKSMRMYTLAHSPASLLLVR